MRKQLWEMAVGYDPNDPKFKKVEDLPDGNKNEVFKNINAGEDGFVLSNAMEDVEKAQSMGIEMEEANKTREKAEKREQLIGKIKIWVVEDQYLPQIILLNAVKENFGEFFEDFKNGEGIFLIDNYADAEKILENDDLKNNIVLLDNRMPSIAEDRMGKVPAAGFNGSKKFDPVGFEMYDEDLDHLSKFATNGYKLINKLKAKGMIVIGTSSMNEDELRSMGTPDYQIKKDWSASIEMLAMIKDEILDKIEK